MAAEGARIYGTVLDAAGKPANGEKVFLVSADTAVSRVALDTRGEGSYSGALPAAGRWTASVEGKVVARASLEILRGDKSVADKRQEDVVPKDGFAFDAPEGAEVRLDLVLGDARTAAEAALAVLSQRVQKGDCAGAVPELEKLAADQPAIPKTQYLLGFCRATAGQDDKALEALSRTLELQPKFPGAALLKGQILARGGKTADAEAAYRQEIATAANPQVVSSAWMALAATLRDAGRVADADAALDEVLKAEPTRRDAWAEKAKLLAHGPEPDRAFEALDHAKAAGVSLGGVALDLVGGFYKAKDLPRAEKALAQAEALGAPEKNLALGYAVVGQMQAQAGKKPAAIASFKKSLELDPNGKAAEQVKQSLKALGK